MNARPSSVTTDVPDVPPEPEPARRISEREAEEFVAAHAVQPGADPQLGVELEWLLVDKRLPRERIPFDTAKAVLTAAGALPRCAALTWEPGGALELSSRPADTLGEALAEMTTELAAARAALGDAGISLVGAGLDPVRPPHRLLDAPRYAAMETFLDRRGDAGRWMMTGTASVQVCVHSGHERPGPLGFRERWRLAHDLGPVLVASFANSPIARGVPTGWRSTRQAVWSSLDPSRTRPPIGDDPREAWARYALDAEVLAVRTTQGPWLVPEGLTFRDWIRTGQPRTPTADDLAYHLTTLFPPVRPRGYLELRMIDAQPGDRWTVPFAVATALLTDARAADRAADACEPLRRIPRVWQQAARHGLSRPAFAAAAATCFEAALDALPRLGAPPPVSARVAQYADRFVLRGLTPADDHLASLLDGRSADDHATLWTDFETQGQP
ncbi:MAG: ergothioneine biosynthesis glutamate--cysteine ligase EgtA [Hamadaea sp.]|uniref:ergothioneine biosynthesis glutamate--cysteine ligase EgtA n=1 Tax=Hamadaea sp. TaxID=2024425 RepID=UPI0017EFAA75|nr:ergothioneine biosynthesis glutamate--cysteine ligase EgtA [Hamadaea sp.]NUT19125.1 ergothioneine biosynthesis glutamate--cysteine ligase EgtA [Hamadaea sp.]